MLLQDLKFALRSLRKHPGYAVAALLTLAGGIGAVTAILSIVNGVILRPLPYPNADRAVLMWMTARPGTPGPAGRLPFSGPNFLDLKAGARTLEHAAAFRSWPMTFAGQHDAQVLAGARVSAGFFEILGMRPLLGRVISEADDLSGAEPVVVLGHGLWRERFGRDPAVIGRTIILDHTSYTVIGVMPEGFAFPRGAELPSGFRFAPRTEIWTQLALEPGQQNLRGLQNLAAIALPRAGASVEQVTADFDLVMRRLEEEYPNFNTYMTARPAGLLDGPLEQVGPALGVLLGAVGFLLLLACANVSNLLLARAVARAREIAIRGALGAGRGRMVRQFITENLFLATMGTGLGLILAIALKGTVLALAPATLPRMDDIALDWRVYGIIAGVMLLVGLGLGVMTATQLTAGDRMEDLREGARSGGGLRARRFRDGLTALEVALSVVLLVGAVTLGRTFLNLRQIEPGFEPESVVTARLVQPFRMTSFADFPRLIPVWARFQRELLDRIAVIPGVGAAGIATWLPLTGAWENTGFEIIGKPPPTPDNNYSALFAGVTPGYFEALGIQLIRGRTFSRDDPDSLRLAVVSETLAEAYWPGEEVVGRQIRVFSERPVEIAGVVANVQQRRLGSEPVRMLYLSPSVYTAPSTMLVIRSGRDPAGVIPPVRAALRDLDRSVPLTTVVLMEDLIAESLAQQRFSATLLTVFSLGALALAVFGLYGVISFGVARRAREFGVRLALGADPRRVQWMVLREGLTLALLGVGAGLGVAAGFSRMLSGLVYGASTTDPATLAGVTALLTGVTLAAAQIPARRAMRVDPAVVLREE